MCSAETKRRKLPRLPHKQVLSFLYYAVQKPRLSGAGQHNHVPDEFIPPVSVCVGVSGRASMLHASTRHEAVKV